MNPKESKERTWNTIDETNGKNTHLNSHTYINTSKASG